MGCDEEEGEFATESPLAAKVKPSILNNDPYVTKIPKLPVFNIDVPTSISQAMIRIMDVRNALYLLTLYANFSLLPVSHSASNETTREGSTHA